MVIYIIVSNVTIITFDFMFCLLVPLFFFFFFFNDTATTEIYTLSLHDALPISARDDAERGAALGDVLALRRRRLGRPVRRDRKSTRLNSSHVRISYAVFCLKKKNKNELIINTQQQRLS